MSSSASINTLRSYLTQFFDKHIGLSKGSLSLVLILTRNAQAKDFPLNKADFVTGKGGQSFG